MTLGPKDLVATLAAGLASFLGYLAWTGAAYPWHLSHRWAILIILVAGLGSCMSFSPKTPPAMNNPFVIFISIVGGLVFLFTIIGLVKPSATLVEVLALGVVLMWLVTTIRHLTTH